MIRIRALNEEGNNSDDESEETTNARKPTREILEQEAMELYNSSFELVATRKYDEAVSTIETILDLPFLEEDDCKKCSPVQLQIKLGCLKTLSSIYYSLSPNPHEALRVFKLALALDPTNVTLWYRLGQVAIKVVDLDLAYYAFAQGFEHNSNHWGCLENLITLSYVLFDSSTCLEYCALGLAKDSGFVRGLVFRDHIFRLQPSIKDDAISKWCILATEHKYSKEWEQKYLAEVRHLFRIQTQQSEENWKRERAQAPIIYVCPYQLKALTFSELCRVLSLLYHDARKDHALGRPVQLNHDIFAAVSTLPGLDATQPNSAVLNEDEKENGVEMSEHGSESILATENGDESQMTRMTVDKEGEDDETRDSPNKKKKRDVKWWQIEGKRRSQRVRGNLFSSCTPTRPATNKETDFATKLNNIFPKSLLSTEESGKDSEQAPSSTTSPALALPNSTCSQNYFGSDEEVGDVEAFLADHVKSNTMNLILDVIRLLTEMTDKEWPSDLATNYIQLYSTYRNLVPQPDPYSCNEFIQQSLPVECSIALTMLELLRESCTSVEKLKSDVDFNITLFFVTELCRVITDEALLVRFHWFLGNYQLSLAMTGQLEFSSPRFYFEDLVEVIEGHKFRIPTKIDNLISLEEVRKKLIIIQRTENVSRITELYESKNYVDLIEILPFCARFEGTDATANLMNRFYLADSYFQLQRYSESHAECLNIIKTAKLPANNQILHKTVLLLKRLVKLQDQDIPVSLIQQTIRVMVALLVDNRLTIPVILPISPWIILHSLLFKLEQQDPAPDEDSTPASIQLLQFAHEQLGRTGKCSLNKGKLLNYTLDSLLPLVSNERYSEHEPLKHTIQQAIFCLHGHPTKLTKFRYLTDHGNTNITMELSRGRELYAYYCPETLPEFDSYDSISETDAALFLHILTLIPSEVKPVTAFNELREFLNDSSETYSSGLSVTFDAKLVDIFYLLGDHYFKMKEWTKSTEFYTWDLAVSRKRFDSWAGIALAKAERITTLLNSCGNFEIMEVMSVANVCVKCFQHALELNPGSSKLSIEFGSFLYAMHAFCSRLLKNTDQLSLEHYTLIESKKEEFLSRTVKYFEPVARSTAAGNGCAEEKEGQPDELWIHHYMLGKVMEKSNPHSPAAFLDQYEMAAKRLDQHGAVYPMKINYYSPQELAIEALEIFYRIHASILNYVEKHDYNLEMDRELLKYLERANESPFMKAKHKRPESATETKRKKRDRALSEVKLLLDDMVGRVEVMEQEEAAQENKSPVSSSTHSSSTSSDEDSTDTSTGTGEDSRMSISKIPPQTFTTFRLSVFQDMLRENELRELRLVEAARIAEEKKKTKEKDKATDSDVVLIEQPPPSSISVSDEELHFKDVKYGLVIARCVKSMQECIARFSAHHKSYFRISYTYSTFCKSELRICRDWLLGSGGLDKKKIAGLFGDRKPSNFFNGIWRNPIDDIDRPGSFPYHMSKTVQNLLEVLNALNDHEMLLEIGIQLSKIPDSDKKYLHNLEREQFSKQALTSAIGAAKRLLNEAGSSLQEVALRAYSSYLKIQKTNLKDNGMGPVLIIAYEKYITSKGLTPEPAPIEFVLKYYQHLSWTTKLKTSSHKMKTRLGPRVIKKLGRGENNGKFRCSSQYKAVVLPSADAEGEETKHDPSKKVVITQQAIGDEMSKGPRLSTSSVNMKPIIPALPSPSPSSSSTTSQPKNSALPTQVIRKKPPLEPAPALIKRTDNARQSGREMPNLVSIPTTAEDYLKFGGIYGLGATAQSQQPSSSVTNTILTKKTPSNVAQTSNITVTKKNSIPSSTATPGKEEFILPDVVESTVGPRTAKTGPARAPVNTLTAMDKKALAEQKYKELSAQAHEAMTMFEKTRAMWDKTTYKTPSLFTAVPPQLDPNILAKYANYYFNSPAHNEIAAKFQLKPKNAVLPRIVPSPNLAERFLTDSTAVVKTAVPALRPGTVVQTENPQTKPPSISPGSIVLEGETVPVFGYTGDGPGPTQIPKQTGPAQTRQTGPGAVSNHSPNVVPAPGKKRFRSGGKMADKNEIRTAQGKPKSRAVARKKTGRPRPPSTYKSPPVSTIPYSTISTYNTSPFKAQLTMVSNPGQFTKGHPQAQNANRRASSPPAAHSANKTPPHASSAAGSTEIIDLTTKSPVKIPPTAVPIVTSSLTANFPQFRKAPETENVVDAGMGRGVKRPMPQMIAIGTATAPGVSSINLLASHSLPPKKKLAVRKLGSDSLPQSPRSNLTSDSGPPEIITLDSD